jgi:tellurite resistance protein TerC
MKLLRRILISLVGGTVLLIGVALILLPAPSTLIIFVGLAILALEFTWAKSWLGKVRASLPRASGKEKGADAAVVSLPAETDGLK